MSARLLVGLKDLRDLATVTRLRQREHEKHASLLRIEIAVADARRGRLRTPHACADWHGSRARAGADDDDDTFRHRALDGLTLQRRNAASTRRCDDDPFCARGDERVDLRAIRA